MANKKVRKRGIKPVLPSLKEKKRYIVYEVIAQKPMNFSLIKNNITEGCSAFIGKLGLAKAGFAILNDWKGQKGILKVNTKHLDAIRASLSQIRKINKEQVIVRAVGVSGILNKARSKFM